MWCLSVCNSLYAPRLANNLNFEVPFQIICCKAHVYLEHLPRNTSKKIQVNHLMISNRIFQPGSRSSASVCGQDQFEQVQTSVQVQVPQQLWFFWPISWRQRLLGFDRLHAIGHHPIRDPSPLEGKFITHSSIT